MYRAASPHAFVSLLCQAAAEGDGQSVISAASAAGCSAWFLAHAPLLLAASPRGAAALRQPLPHAGGDQVGQFHLIVIISFWFLQYILHWVRLR